MSHFNPYFALQQCTPDPLSEAFRLKTAGGPFYQMVFPQACCAWDRDFYLQAQLLEFNFSEYAKAHGAKSGFVLLARRADVFKAVRHVDGTTGNLPVLVAYICVNRALFPPLGEGNRVEWSELITNRTKSIAHELLFIDQYAKYYDVATGLTTRAIEIPTVDQEDELLCPSHEIEAFLHAVEQRFGIGFDSETAFLSQQATVMVQSYYQAWQTDRGVERDVCHRRTCAYLRSGMRAHHRTMQATLDACMRASGICDLDPATFKRHVAQGSPFSVMYLAKLRAGGCNCAEREVIEHTSLLLRRSTRKAKAR